MAKENGVWFDENDMNDLFDNKSFGFRVFTSPGELHEHFEKQMEEMLKMFDENGVMSSEGFSRDTDENIFKVKPGLKRHIEEFHKAFNKAEDRDRDLDDKAYSDQLKTLLDRIAPENQQNKLDKVPEKRTEEQQVMDRIHDTLKEAVVQPRPRRRVVQSPHHLPNGVFDGNGPRVFGQSIISQTIRRPDGTVETRRTIRDSDGHTKTTITRSENGEVKKITTYSDDIAVKERDVAKFEVARDDSIIPLDRNLYLTRDGYTMPRNLW